MSIYAGVSSMMEMESHSGLMDPADDKFTKLIQEMDDFKNKFSPIPDARLSTGNGPHQDHLQVPSSGAAEAMILMKPTALKPTLEGLKKAEDALAETTKRTSERFFIATFSRERTRNQLIKNCKVGKRLTKKESFNLEHINF
ncbi:hypothetical protein CDAR_308971 [Caerostris darwini]|uniref:Uncharacterized protein n=1 Tax=Caerostris darwini TaxID=1538125 RepID=A0AAV4U5R4_9ARAC|nr:hypothetical protein CDAR_308971 [Caerostris darwini]